jgi:hypothetical protein
MTRYVKVGDLVLAEVAGRKVYGWVEELGRKQRPDGRFRNMCRLRLKDTGEMVWRRCGAVKKAPGQGPSMNGDFDETA